MGLGKGEESMRDDKPYYSVERQTSSLGTCKNIDTPADFNAEKIAGKSKIDHENVEQLTTMPTDTKLSSLILSADDCQYVDSFVAMSLSNDGESVEVKYIVKKVCLVFIGFTQKFKDRLQMLKREHKIAMLL